MKRKLCLILSTSVKCLPLKPNYHVANYTWKWKCESLSHVQLFATPWTAAHQASLSMEFSRQKDCHSLLQRIFPIQGPNPGLPHCKQIVYHLGYQTSPLTMHMRHSNVPSQWRCKVRMMEELHPQLKPTSPLCINLESHWPLSHSPHFSFASLKYSEAKPMMQESSPRVLFPTMLKFVLEFIFEMTKCYFSIKINLLNELSQHLRRHTQRMRAVTRMKGRRKEGK